jgi:Cu2+-exporting ATPase
MASLAYLNEADEKARAPAERYIKHDKNGENRLELSVFGAHCANCISKIERTALAVPGIEQARLNLSTSRLTLLWRNPAVAPDKVVAAIEALGYRTLPFDSATGEKDVDERGRMLLRCMAVAGFASMNVMLLAVAVWAGFGEMGAATRSYFYWFGGLIALPAAIYAGRPFFYSAWNALRHGRANMDVPISLGVLLTLAVSVVETIAGGKHAYFDGAVSLLFLLLIGRYLDHHLRQRARAAAKDLLAMQVVAVRKVSAGGAVESVPAASLLVNDRILLAPGDRTPVNGVIEEGRSDIDRALVTGESTPVFAKPGDVLMAGVVNLTRPLVLRATSTTDTSLLADLARLIEQGEQNRSAFVRIADKAAQLYVPIVHTLALATFLGWLLIGEQSLRASILAAVTVLIITCPCALGLAVPAVQVVATGRLFRRGVFVRSGDGLERLAQIDCVMLDKTGTLTTGAPRLVNAGEIPASILAAAAELARASRHPFARALANHVGPGLVGEDITETQGAGVAGRVNGRLARLGKRSFAAPHEPVTAANESELWFDDGVNAPVRLAFADTLRPDAARVIAEMERRGLKPMILSGDHEGAVKATAESLGLGRYEANLSPADKVARIQAAQAGGKRVLMIGDGLNDAAALASAHASMSPGTAVDATQAAADVIFEGAELGKVLEALDVARSARARVFENLAFSATYNLVAIPVAMAGLVTPLIAALAMAGSSLAVTLNALRLTGPKGK